MIGLFLDEEKIIQEIKKKGIFRTSKYHGKSNRVLPIVKYLLHNSNEIFLSLDTVEYLTSVINLSSFIHKSLEKMDKLLAREIVVFNNLRVKILESKYGYSFLKTILAYADLQFIEDDKLNKLTKLTNPENNSIFSKEEVAEACSYITYLYKRKFPSNKEVSDLVFEEYIISGKINKLIIAAGAIRKLLEFEVMIDSFGYLCCATIKNCFEFYSKDHLFEKSMRVSYIRNDMQFKIDSNVFSEKYKDSVSLKDFTETFKNPELCGIEHTGQGIFERYIFKLDERILNLMVDFINNNRMFKEELILIEISQKELINSMDNILENKLRDNLTIGTFMKFNRFFKFMFLLFTNQISSDNNFNEELFLRSLIPVFKSNMLFDILKNIGNEDDIRTFLETLIWLPECNKIYDLQYQPITKVNDYYYIPLSVIANSNMLRNIYVSERMLGNQKLNDDGQDDLLVSFLYEELKNKQFTVFMDKNYNYNSKEGEFDILAIKDNHIFVFECKRSIHPTNMYELRTTYDYIKKAEDQLDLAIEALSDKNFRQSIDILENSPSIHSMIVLGNRLFNGSKLFKHPVVTLYELYNFISAGFYLSLDGVEYQQWEKSFFQISDLVKFSDISHSYFRVFHDSLVASDINITSGNKTITYKSFRMDLDLYNSNVKNMLIDEYK